MRVVWVGYSGLLFVSAVFGETIQAGHFNNLTWKLGSLRDRREA